MDVREQSAFHRDKGAIQRKLMDRGVMTLIRQLPLGDFLWLVKERVPPRPDQLTPDPGCGDMSLSLKHMHSRRVSLLMQSGVRV